MAKEQKNQQKKASGKDSIMEEGGAVPAIVESIAARTGTRGEITQVKCRILQGRNMGEQMRRNVRGHIRPRDILMLRETEIEARRVMKRIKRGSQS